jgi:hypothetical protein
MDQVGFGLVGLEQFDFSRINQVVSNRIGMC